MANILGGHSVKWRYYENKRGRRVTACKIKNPQEEVIAEEEATLFHKDKFSKKIGRAESFKKAMEANLSLTKEQKGAIWKDFRTKIAQPETIN